jgi:hypothetical protein
MRAVGLACLLLAVSAGSAAAAEDFEFFKSPSGNIMCMYMAPTNLAQPGRTSVRCDVLKTTAGRTRSAEVTPRGRVKLFTPSDVAGGTPQPVLRYGATFRRGPFRCTSRVRGMTCRSVLSGHGFELSRERQRTF